MSRPIWAAPPVSGARKPILMGGFWACAGGGAARVVVRTARPKRAAECASRIVISISPSADHSALAAGIVYSLQDRLTPGGADGIRAVFPHAARRAMERGGGVRLRARADA